MPFNPDIIKQTQEFFLKIVINLMRKLNLLLTLSRKKGKKE